MIGYRTLIAVAVTIASLVGAFSYGHHVASVAAERDALALRVEYSDAIETLGNSLRESNAQLALEQLREIKVQNKEVIKYVVKYREKLIDSGKCVNDSGLLELINSTTPTSGVKAAE